MASVDLNAVTAVLKKDILPAVVDAVKQDAMIYQLAKRSFKPQKFINNKFYVPVKLALSSGITSWGTTTTPTVNKGKIAPVSAEYTLNQLTAAFSIDQITLDAGRGAVIDTLELQSEGAKDSLIRMLNFGLYREGGDTIALADGAGSSTTTLVLKSGRTVDNGDIDFAMYIPVGSSIKIGANDAVTVTGWTDKNTLTISASKSWGDDDPVKVLDADGNVQSYITGLLSAVGTGTYAGIDPASYHAWKSYVDSPGSGKTLALTDIDKAHLEANTHGGKVEYTIANKTLYAKFIDLLKSNPRVQVTEKPVLHGGYVGVDYMGHQFILDPDCPDDTIFNISPKELALAELHPLEFLPAEKGILKRAYGKTEWEAIAYTSLNLVTYNRGAHSRISDRKATA